MKYALLVISLCISCWVFPQYSIIRISSSEGMTNSSVNCLFEDSDNVLWLGTWDGLNSYNGRDIKTYRYNKENKKSISNNIIYQIIEQNSEIIWVATNNGVNRFNKKTQQFEHFLEGHRGFIMAIMSDKTPLCYIHHEGIYYYNTASKAFFQVNIDEIDEIDIKNIRGLNTDSKNNLYILSNNGVVTKHKVNYINGEMHINKGGVVESNKDIFNFLISSEKLILNYSSFLKIIDTNTFEEYKITLPRGKDIHNVACLDDIIYIHYNNNDFAKYSLRKKKFIEIKEVSNHFPVFSMCVGAQGILWIGSDGQGAIGVHEYSSPFRTFKMDATVRCFAEENDKLIWVGTKGNGIKLIDKETEEIKKTITEADGLMSNSIYALKKNSHGDIFVGADGFGIDIITPKHTIEHLVIPSNMPLPENIYTILFSSDTLLWAGTNGNGLCKINVIRKDGKYIAKNITRFTVNDKANSINSNAVYSIEKNSSSDDLLWIGTRSEGGVNLFEISSNKFVDLKSLDKNLTLSNNDVLCLVDDKKNNLWVGTSYGLNRFITKKPYSNVDYSESKKFVNNTIHGILEDKQNNIWMSTNYGILYLDTKTEKITHYTVDNGLHSNEFSDGAYYHGKDSTFFFGGVNGFTYFYPSDIKPRSYSPTISLSNLQINNVDCNIYDRITDNTLNLSYNEPYLNLTFIANDFINNKNCEYSYRIKGFVDEWMYNAKQPNINLTKLPPGKYSLDVKCTNGDGVWGYDIYTLYINIGYPWWRSNIAYLAYFLIVVGLIYILVSIIKNRIKLSRQILLERVEKEHQQQIHESKLNFFTNVAHEFFTPLSLIYAPSQLLLERSNMDAYAKRYLQIIKNNAERMQKLIKELMEFRKIESGYITLNPEEIDIIKMVEYVIDNYAEIAKINNIEIKLDYDSTFKLITDRACLDKILFNLISNAFKYTPSGNAILISMKQTGDDNSFVFIIKNSGIGLTDNQMKDIFDRFKIFEELKSQNSSSNGIGLNLTKNLVELLGGTILVESIEQEYVQFKVNLPSLQPFIIGKDSSTHEADELNTNYSDLNLSERKKEISILIVEDDKGIRELLRDILSPKYNVKEALDGLQGLAEVDINMPDIIISDIMMPNMDGINFISRLRSDIKTSHIPIISLSAKNDIEDHIKAYKHGTDLYIEKPFNPSHILSAVENIIEKHSILKQYFKSKRSGIKVQEGIELYGEDEKFIQETIVFIEKNIDDESLNPIAVCEHLNMSKTIFYDRLKKTTGKTPSEFIKIIRLEYASSLLKSTQFTTSEIIFKSGFSSRSYFYREFAKHFNMSPNEFKNKEK